MNETRSASWKARAAVLFVMSALLTGSLEPEFAGTDAAKRHASARRFQEFSNSTPIAIPSNDQASPSTITVSGLDTLIADVNVSLNVLSHPTASDLDVLLVSPGGQTALILSDAGGGVRNDSLIFDDQAPAQLPTYEPLVGGIFQPTNYDYDTAPDTFAAPAPRNPPSGTSLAVFNGTDANGTWTLFIREQDNNPVEIGSINGGWSLRITTANGAPIAAPDSFQTQAGQTLTVPATGVLKNDSDPDGDDLTALLAGQPAKGRVELLPDGSFTYKSIKKAKGTDSFTYVAQDATGLTALETVSIQVKGKKHKKRHKR
jgi:subtilisin-like proprotein convertase family protein